MYSLTAKLRMLTQVIICNCKRVKTYIFMKEIVFVPTVCLCLKNFRVTLIHVCGTCVSLFFLLRFYLHSKSKIQGKKKRFNIYHFVTKTIILFMSAILFLWQPSFQCQPSCLRVLNFFSTEWQQVVALF